MAHPKGRKNIMRTKEEKEELILDFFNSGIGYKTYSKKKGIDESTFFRWIKKYQEDGINGLKSQTGSGSTGRRKKPTSYEEELELKIMQLEIENERLKKGYLVKGGGAKKEYVTTLDKNMK